MTRYLPGILAMSALVVASNILVQFLFGNWLTWGAFTYPFAFLITDVMNRVYGPDAAKRVVLAGFGVGIACSLVAAGFSATTLRIALGSGLAFVVAQMTDVVVFDRLRAGRWWRAPLVSTLIGATLDTVIFFSVAFSAALSFIEPGNDTSWATGALPMLGIGPQTPLWVSLAVADWGVKLALALLALPLFRIIVKRLTAKVA